MSFHLKQDSPISSSPKSDFFLKSHRHTSSQIIIPHEDLKIQQPYSSSKGFKFIKTSEKPLNVKDLPFIEISSDIDKFGSPHFNVNDEIKDSYIKGIKHVKYEEKENIPPNPHEFMSSFSFGYGLSPQNKNVEKPNNLPFCEITNLEHNIDMNKGVLIQPKILKNKKRIKNVKGKDNQIENYKVSELTDPSNISEKISTVDEIISKKKKGTIPKSMKKLNDYDDFKALYYNFVKILKTGKIMLKFGRKSYFGPTKRRIYFNEDMNCFYWSSVSRGENNKTNNFKEKNPKKRFDLRDIKEVIDGRKTYNFKRFKTNDEEKLSLSFSIILRERTVDLQAYNANDKEETIERKMKIK